MARPVSTTVAAAAGRSRRTSRYSPAANRPIERHLHDAPHQGDSDGIHGFFSRRMASNTARSLAVSRRSARRRTSNCSREP